MRHEATKVAVAAAAQGDGSVTMIFCDGVQTDRHHYFRYCQCERPILYIVIPIKVEVGGTLVCLAKASVLASTSHKRARVDYPGLLSIGVVRPERTETGGQGGQ